MMTRTRYSQDYLQPGMCSLIKPAGIYKIDFYHFPQKPTEVCYKHKYMCI